MYISPCTGVCTVSSATQLCQGCGRSILEIRNWKEYSDDQKMEVMRRLGYGVRRKRINKTANSQINKGDEDGN